MSQRKCYIIKILDYKTICTSVETVVLLSQHKSIAFVEIELDLDGLPLTSSEVKATYSELKEYILKNDGLNVSSLYIAQVKSKLGLEKRENSINRRKKKRLSQHVLQRKNRQ